MFVKKLHDGTDCPEGKQRHEDFMRDWLDAVNSAGEPGVETALAEFERKFEVLAAKYQAGRESLAVAYLRDKLYHKREKFVSGTLRPPSPLGT